MPHIKEHKPPIIKYGNNLIKVKIWEYLAHKKGQETEQDVKTRILEQLKISPRQLTVYLDNVSQPTIQEFFEIAQILECTVNDLFQPEK